MREIRPKVLVTRQLPEAVEARLSSTYDVTLNADNKTLSKKQLSAAMAEYDALVPTVSDQIDAHILQTPGRQVRIIANVGVGYSNIDTDTARVEGIAVSNTPDVLTDATADIALLLILAATRHTYAAEKKLRENRWSDFSLVDGLGSSVQGKVLGIIGMGRIGQATARRARLGLGMNVIFYNRSTITGLDFEATQVGAIDEVMTSADVISIHAPGGGSSPLVNAGHIAKLKPTAYLINTARGDCIDQTALIEALSSNRIAGAGLDVFTEEPHIPDVLRKLDNVTLLPHIGSATLEVRTAMGMLAVDNLDAFFSAETMPCRIV
ncbi:MAG: D-glycerate dehydrogenase [SAR86 cluster bacterium]|uniref:D-glycerate dehydrogenase n=1 Tax=SAR86 cluster bacterium TaxID=2030880 RepID=A0A2A5CDW8_9GAMM|nr:D-glycerate dehydrogenase [Gammaproteobacteria bacterium AH-315-E17]PCJ41576.1 MAG: D-glycerate dehydrogenase [SAR86 cluster bacterium]